MTSTARSKQRNLFIDDQAREDDGSEEMNEDDEDNLDDLFDDEVDGDELERASTTTPLKRRAGLDSDDNGSKRPRLQSLLTGAARYHETIERLHDEYTGVGAGPSRGRSPTPSSSGNEEPEGGDMRPNGTKECIQAMMDGHGQMNLWSVPFEIIDSTYRHHDARWVCQQLQPLIKGTTITRVFPHPSAARTLVIMDAQRVSWLPQRGVEHLIGKVAYLDHLSQGLLRGPVPHANFWSKTMSPAAAEDGATSTSARSGEPSVPSQLASETAPHAIRTAPIPPTSPVGADGELQEAPEFELVRAPGIRLAKSRAVPLADHPRMQAAYELYQQELDGIVPAPEEDLGSRTRAIMAKQKFSTWLERVPCWVRMNHGRYSGDIGLLVGLVDKFDDHSRTLRPAGLVFLVPRLPEHPSQKANESYSTTSGSPRRRFAPCHFHGALAKRLFPAGDYMFEKNHDWVNIPNVQVHKFQGPPPTGDRPLVEYLAGHASGRSSAFAVRQPWLTESDRSFSLCPKPSDAEILNFDPFALGELFETPVEFSRFRDAIRPRHGAQAAVNNVSLDGWNVGVDDPVRVLGGDLKGATGVVEDVFPDVGIAHVRVTDPGATPHPRGRLSGACWIVELDKDFNVGHVVSFSHSGQVVEGSVFSVDVVASEEVDIAGGLQRVHVFVREDLPVIIAFSRTCRLVTSGDLPKGGTLRLQAAPSDGFDEAKGMLEDLHDDLSKLAKVKLVEESSGETSFLVDGAALRLRERVSVARGKLQGHWGIVRDIRADSLSLIFERCGDDSCPGQLVHVAAFLCAPFVKQRKRNHWLHHKRVICKTRTGNHKLVAFVDELDEDARTVYVAWENTSIISSSQREWLPVGHIIAVEADRAQDKGHLFAACVHFTTNLSGVSSRTVALEKRLTPAPTATVTPPGSPMPTTEVETAWTLAAQPNAPAAAASNNKDAATSFDDQAWSRLHHVGDGVHIGDGSLLMTTAFRTGLSKLKAAGKRVFVKVYCERMPLIEWVRIDPGQAASGAHVAPTLVGLEVAGAEHPVEPQEVLLLKLDQFQHGPTQHGIIVKGGHTGRVVKNIQNDAGLADSMRTVSLVQGGGVGQSRLVRNQDDVAKVRYAKGKP